jgi:molybdenum cofactor cytidylyltransferase
MRSVAAVILAAGASTRLKSPKQLARIGTETLLERAVRVSSEAACSPVVVVLGASSELIRSSCRLDGVRVVLNEDWVEGMGSSIRAGVAAVEDVDGVILMTCDMPAVTSSHLRALASSGDMKASFYAGRRGVPAYFPESMFPALMRLEGEMGARELMRCASYVELPGGEMDIDTESDLKIASEQFGLTDRP